ncbi:MAG: ABC transporter ATP-binding protein/permease [Acidimicrobiia bacterium]|nr:ABC transporter ATP-binding protein/permease [Acidimicrobiia bacterium]MDH4307811.1 ABC transporter ATP-binding protein/permease [Acidimicrobiia bacterium]MDH5293461.1 ABC transporter ATP-binding protein/permease [Acidimicrobiia bacterium]
MAPTDVIEHALEPERAVARRGMALIARQLRRARREFTLGAVGTVVYAVTTIVSSYVIGWATDSVLLPAADRGDVTTASLTGVALAILGVAVFRGAGIAFRRIGAYAAQYRLQQRDRVDVTDRLLDLPVEWHRRHPTGELLSIVNADAEAASSVAAPLPMAFGVLVMLAITSVLLVMTDPFLALIGFAVGPAIAISNVAFQRRMRVVVAQAQQLRAEVSEIAHESFDAALVVKTLGREDIEVGRFGARSDDLRDRMVEVGRIRAVFDPLMEALPSIGVLAVLYVGALRVDQGLLTAGTLVTFAYLFRLVALPMRVFAWLLADLPRATVGWKRIEAVAEAPGLIEYGKGRLETEGGATAAVDDVAYRYRDEAEGRGISSISLDIPPRSTVALVGPTGSGKSTIAYLLVRLFDPDQGRVCLDGQGLLDLDRGEIPRHTALVFQEPFLFDDTVRANITLGADYDDEAVQRAATLALAHGFVSSLPQGYDTIIGERGATLSGGQRQRIALARALVRNPRLLVLDDATSAVDPAVEAEILDGLRTLDTSVVIVAYRRSSILLADSVIFVEDGRVTGRGSHDELYARLPPYAELIDAYEREEHDE